MLVDSIDPWQRPRSRAASTASRCRTMRPASFTNTGMRQRRARGDPPVQGLLAFLAFDRKHMAQSLFEQIGPMQAGSVFRTSRLAVASPFGPPKKIARAAARLPHNRCASAQPSTASARTQRNPRQVRPPRLDRAAA